MARKPKVDPIIVDIMTRFGQAIGLDVDEKSVAARLDPRSGDFYQTPPDLADRMVALADIRPGMTVLEPSAGLGRIAHAVRRAMGSAVSLRLVEQNALRRGKLMEDGFDVASTPDFLSLPASHDFDRILMNPPFSGDRDSAHVLHAYGMLKPGGVLVAVVSAGVHFHQRRAAVHLRSLIEQTGTIEDLPEGTFAAEGTKWPTCLVTLRASGGAPAAVVPSSAPARAEPRPSRSATPAPARAEPPAPALSASRALARMADDAAELEQMTSALRRHADA